MKRYKKIFYVDLFLFLILFIICFIKKTIFAQSLTESIDEQLNNIDFSALTNFFDENNIEFDFIQNIKNMLSGNFTADYSSIFNYLISIFLGKTYILLPSILSIVAISIFCGILKSLSGNKITSGTVDIVFFICFFSIIIILFSGLSLIYSESKNAIDNITNLSTIMSPIILTLMIASGGSVSAGIYKPAVTFLSNGMLVGIVEIIFPLIFLMLIFNTFNILSKNSRFKKYGDFINSLIKWIFGISVSIFSVYLSIQGISSATYDGISVKAAKYAISNSIPLVGNLLKDGFDVVVAGSVLIKNSVGISILFALFYMFIPTFLHIVTFSIILKLTSAVIEPITDVRISDFLDNISKGTGIISASVLMAGLMFFITVLLMIFSANSYFL